MSPFNGLALTRLLTIALSAATLATESDGALNKSNLIDRLPIESETQLELLANCLCNGTGTDEIEIGRISTIVKLRKFFQQASREDSKLSDCASNQKRVLRLLELVTTRNNENVCSEKKLALVELYHNMFVSTHWEHVEKRLAANLKPASPVLNNFFMHYAMEISANCQKTLISNLRWDTDPERLGEDVAKFDLDASSIADGSFGFISNGSIKNLMNLFTVTKFDDAILIWDLLESKGDEHFDKNLRISEDYDVVTGEPVRVLVKIKSARVLNKIRDHCHYKLKPFYSKLILPVISLSNLGYSNTGERFERELRELRLSQLVQRWYTLTQICETLLPIKVYEDKTLAAADVVVITKAEAEFIEQENWAKRSRPNYERRQKLNYEPVTNSMTSTDLLDSTTTHETQKLIDDIKLNRSAHDRALRRTLKHLVRRFKDYFASTSIGNFFFPSRHKQESEDWELFESVQLDIKSQVVHSLVNLRLESEKHRQSDSDDSDTKHPPKPAPKRLRLRRSVDTHRHLLHFHRNNRLGPQYRKITRQYRRHRPINQLATRQRLKEMKEVERTLTWSEIFSRVNEFIHSLKISRFYMLVTAVIAMAVTVVAILSISGLLFG